MHNTDTAVFYKELQHLQGTYDEKLDWIVGNLFHKFKHIDSTMEQLCQVAKSHPTMEKAVLNLSHRLTAG